MKWKLETCVWLTAVCFFVVCGCVGVKRIGRKVVPPPMPQAVMPANVIVRTNKVPWTNGITYIIIAWKDYNTNANFQYLWDVHFATNVLGPYKPYALLNSWQTNFNVGILTNKQQFFKVRALRLDTWQYSDWGK